jgi:hypothetical protein
MSTFLVRIFAKFIPHSIVIVERGEPLARDAARTAQVAGNTTIRARKTVQQADRMPTCGCNRPFLTMASLLPLPVPPTC